MKKLYFILVALCFFTTAKAQIITIPDANFKAKLLAASSSNEIAKDLVGNKFKIDANNDGEIQEDEALNVYWLDVQSSSILDLTGISSFSNLTYLKCSNNKLTSLEILPLIHLTYLDCYNNKLTALNVTPLIDLTYLSCTENQLSSLEVAPLVNLTDLYCENNKINSLDVSSLVNLISLACGGNQLNSLDVTSLGNLKLLVCGGNLFTSLDLSNKAKLIYLNCNNSFISSLSIKNTAIKKDIYSGNFDFYFSNCVNLKYICADEKDLFEIQKKINENVIADCNVNSYCSFVPGNAYNTITGHCILDSDNNGCDANDASASNIKIKINDGTKDGFTYLDATGYYSFYTEAGSFTISPQIENAAYLNVSPSTVVVDFATQADSFTQDFCIAPIGLHPDLEITLLPLQAAIPGFDATCKLVYKNKGNTIQSGTVNVTFDQALLDFVASSPVATNQTTNNLSWDFKDLKPFETREITFTLNVNSPMEIPAVNSGTVLPFVAAITSEAIDETPADNIFDFSQIAVNSFDPNDKTCLEGSIISPDLIGQYVHYMIRFENVGTANAKNIVVKDLIDLSKFDISTLVPTSASHSFVTKISEINKVEFIFENINLPFDDATNDGYVAFKIKTKPSLVVGDSFSNTASIYFDYNFPIVTNTATTIIETILKSQDFEFSNYFTLYPNPAKDVLNITAKESVKVQSISIYNPLGQLVLVIPNAEKVSKIDVSGLTTGNYFIKIKADKGSSSVKFLKE